MKLANTRSAPQGYAQQGQIVTVQRFRESRSDPLASSGPAQENAGEQGSGGAGEKREITPAPLLSSTPALILGNPTTGDYDATASLATERAGLRPLPFAEKEAQAIAALFSTEAFIREDATENLVREQVGKAGILHLAAHGKFNPVAPLNSLIALAPDNPKSEIRNPKSADGWLTVGEVYGLDLSHTDLVVLSACQTNLGDLSEGDELVGLTRAFFFAGTPSVIASLWSVEDEATSLLMERFYTHLRDGVGKAAALRQAQLEVREQYPNPYYWSAFVLSGDGGEVGEVVQKSEEHKAQESQPVEFEEEDSVVASATTSSSAAPVSEEETSSSCLTLLVIAGLLGTVGVFGWRWKRQR